MSKRCLVVRSEGSVIAVEGRRGVLFPVCSRRLAGSLEGPDEEPRTAVKVAAVVGSLVDLYFVPTFAAAPSTVMFSPSTVGSSLTPPPHPHTPYP